ncbi:MAG: UDP-glucose 4-epimerase GalE [Alphaproteobacteria bacterium]|nr:UDP-glucose 4-epimerase GalE [Alphaproteobacteria bacterium]
MNPILVTGGAGYIGSHVVLALRDADRAVVVLDDLSTGRRDLVPRDVPFVQGDAGDGALTRRVLAEHGCRAVMHFAGSIIVSESTREPLRYYRNNALVSQALIEACVEAGVESFVFSSSAAVYGMPERCPVDENAPTRPINPYGRTKLITEWALADAAATHGLRAAALRYFNVAGADPNGRSGECQPVASHLLKIAAEVAVGARAGMSIHGDDYDTPDGTCVRDYIHVSDLADAHLAALRHLEGGGESVTLNCGYGHGYSVRQVLDKIGEVLGRALPLAVAPRRLGDPPLLVADAARIRATLGWTPRHDDLGEIVASAIAWERKLLAEAAP